MDGTGSIHEVAFIQPVIDLGRGDVELMKDPLLDQGLVSGGLSMIESAVIDHLNHFLSYLSRWCRDK